MLVSIFIYSLNVLSQELWVDLGLEKRKIHNEGLKKEKKKKQRSREV